jgi:hypothetical protein
MTTTDKLRTAPPFYSSKLARDKAKFRKGGVNRRYLHFYHTHFTAGDEEQFEVYREPKLKTAASRVGCTSLSTDSKFHADIHPMFTGNLSRPVITDTFKYIFHKFKKGIYVKFRNGKLVTFLPFSNAYFVNEYSDKLKSTAGSGGYMSMFRKINQDSGYRFNSKKVNGRVETWFANNCLVRYEYPVAENDTNIPAIRDFLDVLARERDIPDVDFFINKRDYPILAQGKYEPYNHLFDSKTYPLVSHKYDKYAPILSFSTAARNSDILIPTIDDWIRVASSESRFFRKASNDYWPPSEMVGWNDKRSTAIWRGSSTGSGITAETNQRIKLAKIAQRLMLTGSSVSIDAGITSWKRRPRKLEGRKGLRTIDVKSLKLELVNKIPFSKHAQYKYIIHVGGHVAAYRLAAEFSLGSVVVIVEGEYKLWFQKFLVEGVHYVGVKSDLSDLVEKIKWLQHHDDEACKIATHGKAFFNKYLQKKGILDYMKNTLIKISTRMPLDDWVDGVEDDVHYGMSMPMFDTSNLCIDKELKRSKKSVVYTAFSGDGKRYAMKKMLEENSLLKECRIGCDIVNTFKSLHFVKTLGVDTSGRILITEYIEGPTLLQWIQGDEFDSNTLGKFLYTIVYHIKLFQDRNRFMHNDLCPTNIVIKDGIIPVIIDFGRSRGVSDAGELISFNLDNFLQGQDILHLIITTLFHLCRRRDSQSHIAFIKILSKFITNSNVNIEWVKKFTELESKFSRLVSTGQRINLNIVSVLQVLKRWKQQSPCTCLTSIWVSQREIYKKVNCIRNPDRKLMAMYLFCKWANLNTTQGKQLIDKLIKLALKKVAILETLDLGWLKLGLKKLYRAKQGDKKLFMDVMTEFDSLLKFNLPQKLSISIFRELMKCNQTNATNVVEKYSIFLEFKKNLLYKKICLTQIT